LKFYRKISKKIKKSQIISLLAYQSLSPTLIALSRSSHAKKITSIAFTNKRSINLVLVHSLLHHTLSSYLYNPKSEEEENHPQLASSQVTQWPNMEFKLQIRKGTLKDFCVEVG